jgi:hypothetical protein
MVLFAGLAAACAPAVAVAPGSTPVAAAARADTVADRLFFGRSIPGGGTVTDEEWAAFLRDVVTPRFPGGLSVWRAEGQWLDSRGTLEHEQATVVEVIHPASPAVDAALGEIADEYKRRFRQDAVLRITTPVRVRFYE